uniref:RxLR effector candidate protein n=1 Tax=Peronospora matthiolae TaxID=2874970 RepID=A0AAV1TQL8_9STRA
MKSFYPLALFISSTVCIVAELSALPKEANVTEGSVNELEHEPAKEMQRGSSSDGIEQEDRLIAVQGAFGKAESGLETGLAILGDRVSELLKSSETKQLESEAVKNEIARIVPSIHPAAQRSGFYSDDALKTLVAEQEVGSFSYHYLRNVLRTVAKTPDPEAYAVMYQDLLQRYFENDLAVLILRAKDIPSSKIHAEKLDVAQFDTWDKRGVQPEAVKYGLMHLPGLVQVHEKEAKRIANNYKLYRSNLHKI